MVRRSAACTRAFLRKARKARSMPKPVTSATAALMPKIIPMVPAGTCSATSMGSISSDVERNTATKVPSVTMRPAYSVDAIAEKPHCGTTPKMAPTAGPAAPARRIAAFTRLPAACSISSSTKYVTSKNGTRESVSLPASSTMSTRKSIKTRALSKHRSALRTTRKVGAIVAESPKTLCL